MALIVKTNKAELDTLIANLETALAAVNSFQIVSTIETEQALVAEPIVEATQEAPVAE